MPERMTEKCMKSHSATETYSDEQVACAGGGVEGKGLRHIEGSVRSEFGEFDGVRTNLKFELVPNEFE